MVKIRVNVRIILEGCRELENIDTLLNFSNVKPVNDAIA